MTKELLAALALMGCGTEGQSPPPDAQSDAPPEPASCSTDLGCELTELADPRCVLTGAQCMCSGQSCRWTEWLSSCDMLELTSEPAPDIGEVRVTGQVFTPGISIKCDDDTTWSDYSRRRNGVVGTYGRTLESQECTWLDAIETRTPATGECL